LPPPPPDGIERDIAELADRLGSEGLQERVRHLAGNITSAGFLAPFDEELPGHVVERLREVFKVGALRRLRWTYDRGEIPCIEVLRTVKGPFPVNAIRRKRQVLSIFAALFYGRNDVINIYDVGPDHVTLVDLNTESLNEMKLIYPSEWTFANVEYKEFLYQARIDSLSYDLVVCDPPRNLAPEVAWEVLPTIMDICSGKYVTEYLHQMFDQLGVAHDDPNALSRSIKAKTGVDVVVTEIMNRAADVYWVVMHKCS
jgi:hypothetical protein